MHLRSAYETTEHDEPPTETTLYDLPLEILDIVLQKSYLHWILYAPSKQRDEEVIRSLMSVDVCFYRRITRRRYKKAIWKYLKDFYVKTMKGYVIMRNNRNYLLEYVRPNQELISNLVSLNCITLKESRLIQHQHCDRDKNDELLNVLRHFDKDRLSNCMKCLRQTNQKTVARIIENGGGVIKIKVKTQGETVASKILHENIVDLQSRTKPWSERTDKLISQLREEGLEILNSQLDGQTVLVWIWCHSQAALGYIQRLNESNQLRDVFGKFIYPSSVVMTDADRNQFRVTVVVCLISINCTQRINFHGNDHVSGVAILRNEIYVLVDSNSDKRRVICVFENQHSFGPRKEIIIKEIKEPWDIGSCEVHDCLYVSDSEGKCVWKITCKSNDEYEIIKWLTTDYPPYSMSVSSDGQLLMVARYSSTVIMIYGSDAEHIRSIPVPVDIKVPEFLSFVLVVKTSIGNFITSHSWMTGERKKEKFFSKSSGREQIMDEEDQRNKEEENEVGKKKEETDEEGNDMIHMKENKEVYEIQDEANERVDVTDTVEEKARKKKDQEEEEEEKEDEEEEEEMVEDESSPSERLVHISGLSEFTSDGQMVVRRFIPSNETQKLIGFRYLSLDSDDQVFLADNGRVILLDSDLKWNRILLPKENEKAETIFRYISRLCFCDDKKQLIVVGGVGANITAVNLYSVTRI